MPRRTSWRELVFGLVALAVVTGISLVVLIFARVGTLHGATFRLFALTGEARGIIRSSEVWLGGQRVGVVKDIRFLPPSAADSNRLLVVMDVLTNARREIRLNSTAQVRSGGTLLGAPVIYLTIGTSASRGVVAGDTLHALPQPDLETVTSEFAIASRQFPEIIDNVKLLDRQLHSVEGTLGAFGLEGGGTQLTRLEARVTRAASRFSAPGGTVGLALGAHPSLVDRARLAMARADSVRTLIANPHSSFGRFRRDSSLAREVADIRNELDILQAQLSSTNGTLGRAQSDSSLLQAVAKTRREMTLIIADLHRRPLRYVHF